MIPDPRNKPFDFKPFEPQSETGKPKFGLPSEVKYCEKCVISNQRPNSAIEIKHTVETKKQTIFFSEDGVCDACRHAELKRKINWEERARELADLCDRYRRNDGSYDCLVPGSGGKDSFYQAHLLKYKYGMNPLTVTWAPHIYTEWGWRNFQRWIGAGFDNYLMTPNALVHRLLTRLAVDNLFHPFQPFIIGQKNFAPKMAEKFGINLIFYGENEAEYGNPSKDNSKATRDNKYHSTNSGNVTYFGGVPDHRLIQDFGLTKVELDPYYPMPVEKLEAAEIQVHYLGYYVKWHPQEAYYYAHEHGGFEASPERTPGTYSKYNSIDDRIDDFHYLTTFIKFGIGRATYDAAQEIRSGDIDRDEGVALVKRFDGEFPARFADEIFQYISIDEVNFPTSFKMFESPSFDRSYFDALANQFRSPHLWLFENNEWQLRNTL